MRAARPSSASSTSCGPAMSRSAPPDQICAAATSRLGSVVDWRRNSRRQWVPSPVSSWSSSSARTSVSRKQARAAPGGSVPTASQAANASVSGSSRAAAGRRPSGEVRPASQVSIAPRPPWCTAPARARRSRTAASTRTSSASATSAPASAGPPLPVGSSARAAGGIVAANASAAARSTPCTTGRQRARVPPGPDGSSVGRTWPRRARSSAKATTARRCATEAP